MNCASEAKPGQTTSKSRFTYSASGPKFKGKNPHETGRLKEAAKFAP
jgi:hypothetical protein